MSDSPFVLYVDARHVSPYAMSAFVALTEKGVPFTTRLVDLRAAAHRAPDYLHVPLARNAAGEKLSKQTLAMALDSAHPLPALLAALDFLGQQPPADLAHGTVAELWAWAVANWRLERVPRGPATAPATMA